MVWPAVVAALNEKSLDSTSSVQVQVQNRQETWGRKEIEQHHTPTISFVVSVSSTSTCTVLHSGLDTGTRVLLIYKNIP
jgi:hypothetical protein